MDRNDLTVHGFRSTFRDWVVACTNFPHEVAEMAPAHTVSDKVEAAYRRRDWLVRRRALMEAWAGHCATIKTGEVRGIRKIHLSCVWMDLFWTCEATLPAADL